MPTVATTPGLPTLPMMPLDVCALLIIACGNVLVLAMLRRLPEGWKWRRDVHLFILSAPLVGILLGVVPIVRCGSLTCETADTSARLWLMIVGQAMTAAMILMVLGALLLGVTRAVLLSWVVTRNTVSAGRSVQKRANHLAEALGLPHPHVLLRSSETPLAFTFGLRRPTVVLSTWMVERLDRSELDSVLAHELAHAARHDYLLLWVAKVLADAFFYLPTSHAAYRLLHAEKELACDDLALTVTRRPLGLASALAKVWQYAVTSPPAQTAQTRCGSRKYVGHMGQSFVSPTDVPADAMEGRITRLLDPSVVATSYQAQDSRQSLRVAAMRVGSLLVGTGVLVTLMLLVMGCNVL